MSSTISDFANFFRPDKKIIPFSSLKQIHEAIALVEASFKNNNIIIHCDAAEDVMLLGFPNEFSQVLLNLLVNAKDAIQSSNRMDGLVEVRLTARDGSGCITVQDNGGGIPEAIIGRIFDPYFSTKNRGSGIGLYMSKMIIEDNMNGTITARNVKDGAEFTICIPRPAAENPV
jgi:signal transduction histidine kinase